MKRAISILLLIAALLAVMTACGSNKNDAASQPTDEPETEAAEPASEPTDEPEQEAAEEEPEQDAGESSGYTPGTITIFCAYDAGSGIDMQGRSTFNAMKEEGLTPANFVYENFGGGSGQVGFGVALEQREGDQDLIFVLSSTMAMLNEIQGAEYSYKDMIPIGQVADDYNLVVVPGSSPYQTLGELIEASKEEAVVGGCSGAAGIGDILINRMMMESELQARVLPFEGNGNTKTAILGSQIDFAILNVGQCAEFLESGEMRALAVTSEERLDSLPDVPTLMEEGLDIEQSTFRGYAMLPGTPDEIVQYWSEKLAEVVETESFVKGYCEPNNITPHYLNAADFKARLDAEYEIDKEILTQMGLAKEKE